MFPWHLFPQLREPFHSAVAMGAQPSSCWVIYSSIFPSSIGRVSGVCSYLQWMLLAHHTKLTPNTCSGMWKVILPPINLEGWRGALNKDRAGNCWSGDWDVVRKCWLFIFGVNDILVGSLHQQPRVPIVCLHPLHFLQATMKRLLSFSPSCALESTLWVMSVGLGNQNFQISCHLCSGWAEQLQEGISGHVVSPSDSHHCI